MKKFFSDLFGAARIAGRVAGLAALVLASSLAMGQKVTLVPSDVDPMENVGTITLTATVDSAPTADITITVSSSESYLRVPSANTLTIASGATTSTGDGLTLTIADDIIAELDRTAVLSATISSTDTGATAPDPVTITIVEDDMLRMNLQLSGDWGERGEQGTGVHQSCITFSTPFSGSVTVDLHAVATPLGEVDSNNITITENNYEDADLTLPDPPTLTANAGDTQKCWDTTIVDNDEVDGPRFVTLSFDNARSDTVKNVIVGDNTSIVLLVDDDTPPTGKLVLHPTLLSDSMAEAITSIVGGVQHNIATTTAGGTLAHGNGLPSPHSMARSWQVADFEQGPYTEVARHASRDAYTPVAADVGKYVRACVFFQNGTDGDGIWQGAPATAAGTAYADLTQAQREDGLVCSAGLLVSAVPTIRMASERQYTLLESQRTGTTNSARLVVPDGNGGHTTFSTLLADIVITATILSDNNPVDNPAISSDDEANAITLGGTTMTIAAGDTSAATSLSISFMDNLVTLHPTREVVVGGTVEYRKPGTTEVITEGLSWPVQPVTFNILDDDFLTVGFDADAFSVPEDGTEVEVCAVKDRVARSTVEVTVSLDDPQGRVHFGDGSDNPVITVTAPDSRGCTMVRATVPDNYEFDGARSITASITDVAPTSDLLQLGIASTRIHIVDDDAGGRPALAASGSTAALTGLTEDTAYSVAVAKPESGTNAGATVEDGDGLPVDADDNLDKSQIHVSLQDSQYTAGPFNELSTHTADETITLAQAQVGRYVRICIFFEDQGGQHEGAGGTRAAFADLTPVERGRDGRLCSTPLLVTNANDAPVAGDRTISVFDGTTGGSSTTNLHRFVIDDFPFTDEDGDNLASITIKSLPTGMNMDGSSEARGTLVLTSDGGGSANVAVDDSITLANLPKLGYYASVRAGPRAPYGTFTFTVTDDGSDGTGNKTSTNTGTITINLVAPSGQYPATGSPTVTAASGTAYEEDVALTASETGVSDLNGIDSTSLAWQWQRTTRETTDHRFDADAWDDISGATSASHTPGDAEVGRLLRACLSFNDEHSTANAEGPLCSTGRVVTNVNDAPTGQPAVFAIGRGVVENEILGVDASDLGDADGRSTLVFWQWQQADPDGTDPTMADAATWANIEGATGDSFTPDDAQVGKFLRICGSYVDNRNTAEGPVCSNPTATAVTNVNDLPTGKPTIVVHGGTMSVTEARQGSTLYINVTSNGAEGVVLQDPDGFAANAVSANVNFVNGVSWQTAPSPSGPWTEWPGTWSDQIGGVAATILLSELDRDGNVQFAVGSAVRYCLFYTDARGAAEGGPSSTAAERQNGSICTDPLTVTNGSLAPVAQLSRANVFSTVDANAPFEFAAANFMFTDIDGDSLAAVIVTSLPTVGTLRFGDATLTPPMRVSLEQISMLRYHPAEGAMVGEDSYDAFNFKVVDDGVDADAVNLALKTESVDAATMNIFIVTPGPSPAQGIPVVAAESGTAYNEGVKLTAALGTVIDHNGINMASIAWQWQQASDADPNAPLVPGPNSSRWADIEGQGDDGDELTPDQTHVGTYIRVCITFDDNLDPPTSEGPLCSVPPGAIANVNNAPEASLGLAASVGGAAVAAATEGATLHPLIELTDGDGLPAATDDIAYWANADGARQHDGISWQTSADLGITWSEAAWRAASHSLEAADIGKVLRICLFYTDSQGTTEGGLSTTTGTRLDGRGRICSDALPIENVNDAPVGVPYLATGTLGAEHFSADVAEAPSSLTQHQMVATIFTTSGTGDRQGAAATGPVTDADGIDDNVVWAQSIQRGGSATGPWEEVYHAVSNVNVIAYTIAQDDVDAGWLRTCIFYADAMDTVEGIASPGPVDEEDPDADYDSPAERLAGTLCSVPLAVANRNDAPVILPSGVSVTVDSTAEAPFMFQREHFRFEDADDDMLTHISIESAPTSGTLRVGDTEVTSSTLSQVARVAVADVETITFYPETGQDPTSTTDLAATYATFTFIITDDGSDPDTTTNVSSATGTMGIRLIAAEQMPATGMPTVTPAADPTDGWAEDVPLAAAITGVTAPSGVDQDTIRWQWQSAPSPASGAPADGDWVDIANANTADFAPAQAQVGMHIRACVRFQDQYTPPEDQGPLCSTSAQVGNVNDAPTSADSSVNAFTIASAAEPFRFAASDFPFMDEDAGQPSGGTLSGITIISLPALGTLSVGADAATVGQEVRSADLDTISWHPPEGAEAASPYTRFRFSVNDGLVDSAGNWIMHINLVPPGQIAATGAPAVSGTLTQNSELGATSGTVADVNGIDEATITWQWQVAAPTEGGEAPDADSADWADIAGADGALFTPLQAHVGMHLRVCMAFMDMFVDVENNNAPQPGAERRCSAATITVANVNDTPTATDQALQTARPEGSDSIEIPVDIFLSAYSDPDGTLDQLAAVAITALPPQGDGTLRYNGAAVAEGDSLLLNPAATAFVNGALTFLIAEGAEGTSLQFTLSDGEDSSNAATLTIRFGLDIRQEQVKRVSAILSVAAVTNATNAIGGAISGAVGVAGAAGTGGAAGGFDLALGGTSLVGMGRSLHRNLGGGAASAASAPGHDNLPHGLATADQRAWWLGTDDAWAFNAAANAKDDSAGAIMGRLRALADGDLAMQYGFSGDPSSLRIWGRYQRLDLSGNPEQDDGTKLEYNGSSDGFYVGGDRMVTDRIRAGFAMGFDGADIAMDLDGDGTDDQARRKATAIYPYMRMAFGDIGELRVIAGLGQGDLQMSSSANSGLAEADLSWNMLAATFRHARQLPGALSGSLGGSFQTGSSSVSEARFRNGSKIQAGDSSSGEFSIDAEVNYEYGGLYPFASLAARKWSGDLEQSLAFDLSLGTDINTGPLALRLAITRQLNSTTHTRHGFSMDFSLAPNARGISASFGNSWDSLSGRPQWNTRLLWQRRARELSLAVSPDALRLAGKLRW